MYDHCTMPSLSGATILVAGAGFAGLAAAHDLVDMGAQVLVVDARSRVGGRVWSARAPFVESQHAEAGADLIEETHEELFSLIKAYKLSTARILRHGFAYVRPDPKGRPRIMSQSAGRGWARLAAALGDVVRPYKLAEQRWDTPIASAIARQSVASWLDAIKADDDLRLTATGLRGFFLADPDDLSLIAIADQFGSDDSPAPNAMYRIVGGNDCLATAIAQRLGDRVRLKTEVVAVSQRGPTVRVTLKDGSGQTPFNADYVVLAIPATLLRRIPITPSLPARQHEAIATLKYGRATKTLLQTSTRFWRVPGRPRAFGSALPFGALWDGNEEQRGRPGIVTLLAGGAASEATQAIVNKEGPQGLLNALDWLGSKRAELLASQQVVWESDPFARGGYAYFDPSFDPELRGWLARPAGRVFFAGEHTSNRWQGYMNGAVQSGRRAAAEIAATRA